MPSLESCGKRPLCTCGESGANAIERSAYKEAIGFLERALEALSRLPAMKSNAEIAVVCG